MASAGTNNNNGEEQKTATQEKKEEYGKSLSERSASMKNEADICETNYQNSLKTRADVLRCYEQTSAGFDKYKTLSLGSDGDGGEKFGTASLSKDAAESFEMIAELNDNYKKNLNTKMAAAMKALKDLGAKMKTVNEAFCKVEAEIGNNCNSGQLDILRKSINLNDQRPCERHDDNANSNKDHDFDKWIDLLCNDVRSGVVGVNLNIDRGVQVAGLNAVVDLGNLKKVGEAMSSSLENLHSNVDENVVHFRDKTTEECDNMKNAATDVSEKWHELQCKKLNLQGLYATCQVLGADGVACDKNWDCIQDEVKGLLRQVNPDLPQDEEDEATE